MDRGQEPGAEVRRVRHHLDAERLGHRDDPAHLRDAADLRHARLRVVDRAGLGGAPKLPHRAVVLAGGGGDPAPAAHLGQPGQVLRRPHRLLQPVQIERRQPLRHLDRFPHRPRTVGVHHDRHAGPGHVTRGLHLGHGDLVELDVAIAAAERLLGVAGHRVGLAVAQQAGVGRQVGPRAAAEQAVERQPSHLARDVPQRDVDARQRVDRRTVAADPVQHALQIVVERRDLARDRGPRTSARAACRWPRASPGRCGGRRPRPSR